VALTIHADVIELYIYSPLSAFLAGYGVNVTFALPTGVFACADDLLEGKILQMKVVQKYERVFCVTLHILVCSVRKLI
jgi:hypothetical protein